MVRIPPIIRRPNVVLHEVVVGDFWFKHLNNLWKCSKHKALLFEATEKSTKWICYSDKATYRCFNVVEVLDVVSE
jgi:hypothetical protein